jgi:CIC family chloride channel protein
LRYLRAGFSRLPVPVWIRPALGGFIVGCFLVFLPQLHEAAFYQFNLDAFGGVELSVVFLAMLLVAKIIATSVTVGSGGSGGIFAPSLFLGLVVGMLVNSVALQIGLVSSPVLLVVGMAALFAGAAHAPVTAVFLLYEIVDQISILPYLIIGAVTAYFVAKFLSTSHMYTRDNL